MASSQWRYIKILKNDDFSNNLDNCECKVNPLDVEENGCYLWISGKLSCKTAAISSHSELVPQGHIALSKCILYNTRLFPGDTVIIREAPCNIETTAVTVLPFSGWEKNARDRSVLEQLLNNYFEASYRPVCQGDCFQVLFSRGEGIWFKIESIIPDTAKSLYGIDYGIVRSRDVIDISNETYHPETDVIRLSPGFSDLGGNASAILKLQQMIFIKIKYPSLFEDRSMRKNGIILHGPHGCGKYSLSEAAAYEYSLNFKVINARDLIMKNFVDLEWKLQSISHTILFQKPFLLIIKNIEELSNKNAQVVTQLTSFMKDLFIQEGVFVIGTCCELNKVHLSLRKEGCFDQEISIPLPNVSERKDILRVLLRKKIVAEDVNLNEISKLTAGFSGADLKNLLYLVTENSTNNIFGVTPICNQILNKKTLVIDQNSIKIAVKEYIPSMQGYMLEKLTTGFNLIGGLEEAKTILMEVMDSFNRHNSMFETKPITGVLLYGPPGCGKTSLVRAIAREARINLIEIKNTSLIAQSENKLEQICIQASQCKPCIVFINEIDSIISQNSWIAFQIKEEMEKIFRKMNQGIIFMGATNRIELIEESLIKTGRFSLLINVPLPTLATQKKIFHVYLRRFHIDKNVNLDNVATQVDGFSGSDIERLCYILYTILEKEHNLLKNQMDDEINEFPIIKESHIIEALEKFRLEKGPLFPKKDTIAYIQ